MVTVHLELTFTREDWNQYMALMARYVPWMYSNPFLMQVGEQIRKQSLPTHEVGNSGEMPENIEQMSVKQ